MSFWDNVKKFAQPYSEDEYDEYDEEAEGFDEAQEERPARVRRAPLFGSSNEEAPSYSNTKPTGTTAFSGQVVTMGNKQEVVLFHPANFNDTSKAADDLRSRRAVIVNMENVDKAMARRVVDFLSGCAYSIDGSVKKIAQSAYLFCPSHLVVSGDLESLQSEVDSYV